jgi:hypothetical protein
MVAGGVHELICWWLAIAAAVILSRTSRILLPGASAGTMTRRVRPGRKAESTLYVYVYMYMYMYMYIGVSEGGKRFDDPAFDRWIDMHMYI